jgi:hypothetical protein
VPSVYIPQIPFEDNDHLCSYLRRQLATSYVETSGRRLRYAGGADTSRAQVTYHVVILVPTARIPVRKSDVHLLPRP